MDAYSKYIFLFAAELEESETLNFYAARTGNTGWTNGNKSYKAVYKDFKIYFPCHIV